MTRGARIAALVVAALVTAAAVVFFLWLPGYLDGRLNAAPPGPYAASADARDLHASLRVADLHADPLLWRRDPLVRARRGHTDVPRLIAGNVALQVFGAVSKVPRGLNYEKNPADSDILTLLVIAQRWPTATWSSLLARALYQAQRLRTAAAGSGGQLVLVKSAADLQAYLERRATDPTMVAGLLAIEGLQVLEGDPANLDTLYAAGFRMMGLTHFFDNEVAGSAHGETKDGLTELGREVVRRMEERKILIDLAHASPAAIVDVLELASRPVVVSHTGVHATCPGPRNLADELIRAIASTGGVIGVGYWDGAVCETDPASIARAIRHVADLVGVDHVALGSDFDGATHTRFDATGLVLVTEALLAAGFSAAETRQIMGENVLWLLLAELP